MRSAILTISVLVYSSVAFAATLTNEARPAFGFTGPETFPIDPFIGQLQSADFDGDGLSDLVVANNSRSKINVLYNQTGHTNQPAAAVTRRELNDLPPDARFRLSSIASEKRISALIARDLNSDGRPDLAYYGDPRELVVQWNEGTNGWSLPVRWPLDDAQLTPNALSAGDLNGDGLEDLLLLAETHLYFLPQTPQKQLDEPQRIPFVGAIKSAQILDINGDGREDLLLVNWDHAHPFRFRLQTATGQLGPEMHFTLPPIRAYWADDLNGDHKTEIVTIAQNSGRAAIANFVRQAAPPLSGAWVAGQLELLPLQRSAKARRGQAWGDVNADGRPDLLVTEPDSGQLNVYLQNTQGGLDPARTFATLTGVAEVAVSSSRAGRRPRIFLLSPDERQVGMTEYDSKGRVPFPTILPLNGRPLVMALGAIETGGEESLAVVVDNDGKRTLVTREAAGKTATQPLSEQFKSNPTRMVLHDADQDGRMDLVVLTPYEKIKFLRQSNDLAFQEIDLAPPGGTIEQPWVSTADVNADGRMELLLAQRNFVRSVVLTNDSSTDGAGWSLKVQEQINGASANSRIMGATALPKASNSPPALFMLDAERKALTVVELNTNGSWAVTRNLPLPFSEFSELQTVSLGKAQTVALLGLSAVGWMRLAGQTWTLSELDSYETPIRDGFLHDAISGDLNQDGRKDLVFLETGKNYLDIVVFDRHGKLVPADRWQVFEERSFRGRRGDQPEPREALIADLTGDGKKDLAVLVHDRILVYPQE